MTLLYNHVTETGKTDGTKPPSTSMNGCVKAASEIAKYTTDKTLDVRTSADQNA